MIRKYYLYGEDQIGGGVYLWESREAADRMYSEAWKKTITEKFGNPLEITYYDTPVIVDNLHNSSIQQSIDTTTPAGKLMSLIERSPSSCPGAGAVSRSSLRCCRV